MSFLDGILGKLAAEHGIDESKMSQIKELVEKMDTADIASIAEKVGIPEAIVEKVVGSLKK